MTRRPNVVDSILKPAARKSDADLLESDSWRLGQRRKSESRVRAFDRARKRTRPEAPPARCEELIGTIPGFDPEVGAAGYRFDADRANAAVDWIQAHLTHTKGELARGPDPLILEPWEQAVVGNAIGWVRDDDETLRRFSRVFLAVPRKNGKTTIAAAIVNWFGFEDDEPGAELYSAAADRDQARIIYSIAAKQIDQDIGLAARVRTFHNSISYDDGRAVYKALSSEAGTKHGLNPQLVVVDELHAHRSRELLDVLLTAVGARRSPQIWIITTSDFQRVSICNETWDAAVRARDATGLDSPGYDPNLLPAIWQAPRELDWRDQETWTVANPNLGTSIRLDYLERECRRAINQPEYENTFRRAHLNQRTEQAERVLSMSMWDENDGDPGDLSDGRDLFAGLDLSSNTDLAALAIVDPETWAIDLRVWIPRENAVLRERRDKVPYLTWARQGFVKLTDGNVTDFDVIRRDIGELRDQGFQLAEIGVDPWNSQQLQNQLDADGFEVVPFHQSFRDMNEPTRKLFALIAARQLRHGGNPVLRWAASNLAIERDSNENIRPSKKKSTERIDPIVASIMGIGRAIAQPAEESDYDESGLTII